MKKIYCFFLLMLGFPAFAQSGIIAIGSDNWVYPTMPAFSFYGYTYSQQIVPKTRFNQAGGTAGAITKLRYYCESTGSSITPWNNWTIFIGHTNKNAFQGDDWVPVSQMTQVFSGEFTPVAGTWIEFEFAQPFVYNDIDNLVIAVDENAAGWTQAGNAAEFYSYAEPEAKGMSVVSDSTNFDPASPSGGALVHFQVPMLQLEGEMLGLPDAVKSAVSIYPNPSDAIFNIGSETAVTAVEVFDLSGRLVASEKSERTTSIDLWRLQPAQYLLRIYTSDGVFVNRIVKR